MDGNNCNEKEEELFRYMEGLADEAEKAKTQQHLETCRTCRQQVQQYAEMNRYVSRSVALSLEGPHPEAELLVELDEGLLSGIKKQEVQQHLNTCALCRFSLDTVKTQPVELDVEAPPAPLPKAVAALIEKKKSASIVQQLKSMLESVAARGKAAVPVQELKKLLEGAVPETGRLSPVLGFPDSAGVVSTEIPTDLDTGWSLAISRGPLSIIVEYHNERLSIVAEENQKPLKATRIQLSAAGSEPMAQLTNEIGRCTFEPVSNTPMKLKVDWEPPES